jgi:hypothetical protein
MSDGAPSPPPKLAPKKKSNKGKGKARIVEEEEKRVPVSEHEPEDMDDITTTDDDDDALAPKVDEQARHKKKTTWKPRALVEEETLVVESEDEEPQLKKQQVKAKGRQVDMDDVPIPEPDDTQASSPARAKSAAVENAPGSKGNTPDHRDASQPVKSASGKPKPRPIPRKQRQPSPEPLDKDIEILEDEPDAGDVVENGAYINLTIYVVFVGSHRIHVQITLSRNVLIQLVVPSVRVVDILI